MGQSGDELSQSLDADAADYLLAAYARDEQSEAPLPAAGVESSRVAEPGGSCGRLQPVPRNRSTAAAARRQRAAVGHCNLSPNVGEAWAVFRLTREESPQLRELRAELDHLKELVGAQSRQHQQQLEELAEECAALQSHFEELAGMLEALRDQISSHWVEQSESQVVLRSIQSAVDELVEVPIGVPIAEEVPIEEIVPKSTSGAFRVELPCKESREGLDASYRDLVARLAHVARKRASLSQRVLRVWARTIGAMHHRASFDAGYGPLEGPIPGSAPSC